jgi:hypothetical protein
LRLIGTDESRDTSMTTPSTWASCLTPFMVSLESWMTAPKTPARIGLISGDTEYAQIRMNFHGQNNRLGEPS